MAWVRTSLSLISFGFAIHKFFQYMTKKSESTEQLNETGAENLGTTLAVLGTIMLMAATVEHVVFLRGLCRDTNHKFQVSTTLFAAGFLSLMGLVVLLELLFEIGPY